MNNSTTSTSTLNATDTFNMSDVLLNLTSTVAQSLQSIDLLPSSTDILRTSIPIILIASLHAVFYYSRKSTKYFSKRSQVSKTRKQNLQQMLETFLKSNAPTVNTEPFNLKL